MAPFGTVSLYKGMHFFDRNIKLLSKRLIAVKKYSKQVKEFIEGGQHYSRMESFDYLFHMIVVFLKERVGASMCICVKLPSQSSELFLENLIRRCNHAKKQYHEI